MEVEEDEGAKARKEAEEEEGGYSLEPSGRSMASYSTLALISYSFRHVRTMSMPIKTPKAVRVLGSPIRVDIFLPPPACN